jgi:hypothetical protein
MQDINKQKYFYYIAFMLMASNYLPVVFNNLPPFIRSHHLWTFIWVISLLLMRPRFFLNKSIIYLLVYGLFLIIALNTFWLNTDGWNRKLLFDELYQVGIGISVFVYFITKKDFLSIAKLTKWSIIFIFITAIMAIISSVIDPMYARNLTAISLSTSAIEREYILGFKRLGGGTYSTAAAFMSLFPVLIYYYRNTEISILSKKQIITFSAILFISLVSMQIFANILIAITFAIAAIMGSRKINQSIIGISLFLTVILLIPNYVYVDGLTSVGKLFKKETLLNYKLTDMAYFIEHDKEIEDSNTGTGARLERYPILLETFVKRPVLGCYFLSDANGNGYNDAGGHLHWMNKLTTTGILGFFLFLIIPFNFIRKNIKTFNLNYQYYYLLASLSILSYGLMKVITGRDVWYAFFIILPGFYFLPMLKKRNRN